MKKIITLLALFCIAVFAQNTFTDPKDSKKYKTVKIGRQIWMAENLNYDAKGSLCYRNNPANCTKYGRLYDWNTARKICPKGWHLPSDAEWQTLIDFVGGNKKAGKKLKAKSGWNDRENGCSGNGTDDYGFSALPGSAGFSDFFGAEGLGYWWSDTKSDYAAPADDGEVSLAFNRRIYCLSEEVDKDFDNADLSLFSVRCVKD